MRIQTTPIDGVHTVDMEPVYDARGFFARLYDREVFEALGLAGEVAQTSLSQSSMMGTLRGLHWQAAPGRETKLVRVLKGRIFDVVVDLRPSSPTFGQWVGQQLSAESGRALFIPERCAHGFLTLEENVHVLYQMSETYRPELMRTLRWNDPELAIPWPIAPRNISPKDADCMNALTDLVGAATAA